MNEPTMLDPTPLEPTEASGDMVLPGYIPVPGLGVLPVNAFLIRAAEPVLVDAGVPALADGFVEKLGAVTDLEAIRWIWLTHCDPDHVGALDRVLEAAPNARIATNYLGMGKLTMSKPIPPERFYLINPGQQLDVGDRPLVAMRPPCFDAPETMGLLDPTSRTLYSSDCFGALMSAPAEEAAAMEPGALADGMATWSTVDAPWLPNVNAAAFGSALTALRDLSLETVASAHLPPARGMADRLLSNLDSARHAAPFVGPDQQALMAMMEQAA